MATIGSESIIFKCIRNVGVRHPNNPQLRVGGIYTPAHTNAQGKAVSAKWESNFGLNRRGYTNAQGQFVEGKTDFFRITVWSSKTANGKGLAERYARMLSIGCEICVDVNMKTYRAQVRNKAGVVQTEADGTPITVERIGFEAISGSLLMVSESRKLIDQEIQTYLSTNGQSGRPPKYDDPTSPDFQKWQQIRAQKNQLVYQPGMTTLGHAIVVQAKNAQSNAYPNAGATPQAGTTGPAPLVQNYTYEQWATQLTDDQMLAMAEFAPFHNLIMAKRMGSTGQPSMPNANMVLNQPAGQNAFATNY